MMKKVKKKDLPKYAGGTISASKLDAAMAGKFNAPTNFSSSQKMATVDQHRRAISSPGGSGGSSAGFSQAMQGIGQIASALSAISAFSGSGGSVDENTGDVQEATGLTKLFGLGRSNRSLYSKANRIKNSIQARERTQDIQMEYMNDPNVEIQPDVLAAEGGIMRKPVKALVSKGELIYDPETKKLMKVPGSKGKPNKADDVFARLYEGDVVISNSPTMLMANGKTPAQNLMGMVDKYATGGTVKAREAIIKKVVNWQEANKTKPQEYAKFDEGYPGFFKYLMDNRTRPLGAVISEWFRQRGEVAPKFDGFGKLDFLNGIKNIYNTQSDYEAPIKLRDDFNWDQHRSVPIYQLFEFNPNILATKVEKPKNTSTRSTAKMNYSPQNVGIHTHSEIHPVWSRHKTSDYAVTETTPSVPTTNTVKKDSTVVSKKGTANKPVSDNKTTSNAPQKTKLTPEQIAESLRIADIGERHWLRGAVTEPKQSFASLAKITPEKIKSQGVNNAAPLTGIKPLTDTTGTDSTGYTGSNWRDNLYRTAVLSQPLWDRAEAEPVKYTLSGLAYRPVNVNELDKVRAINENYALDLYNASRLNTNTGQGLKYASQAATNRMKQLSDVYSWKTNAQNELIGRNVDAYNRWSENYADIMNNVYDKAAANRAAARNINRQNRTTALNNYGAMLSDDKKMKVEAQNNRLKAKILEPFIESVYENSDELIPMLAPYTMNRNVKKKSPTR